MCHEAIDRLDARTHDRGTADDRDRPEDGDLRGDSEAGAPAPHPVSVAIPDVKGPKQHVLPGWIRLLMGLCQLEWDQPETVSRVEALERGGAPRAETTVGVEEHYQLGVGRLVGRSCVD
jgi:hypothetical protein